MLEKPELEDHLLLSRVREIYGLQAAKLMFLPLGADVNTAVYRLVSPTGIPYFLKLRHGEFDPLAVTLPTFLASRGLQQVIKPVETKSGQLWSELGDWKLILYPYVNGKDGYEVSLSDDQWRGFGAAVKCIHGMLLPPDILKQIPSETYPGQWREKVKAFQAQVEADVFDNIIATRLANFMRQKSETISQLVTRAEQLAEELQARSLEFVLCHSDLHPGNLLLDTSSELFIVDWDNPILAPKEHDLMHIGASHLWDRRHIKRLFFQGYGMVQIDGQAIAYYRAERIVRDIAEFCTQLFDSPRGEKDQEQSLTYFIGQFQPGHEVDIALRGAAAHNEHHFWLCFNSGCR